MMGWIIFNVFILVMLLIDLLVFNRQSHAIRVREALVWSVVWITLALIFNAGIYYFAGHEMALKFLGGYLVEKSLSVDNLFVFLLIFAYFQVPSSYQHKVLFWGIFGALVMRALFIFAGIALIQRFSWLMYLMGAFLIFTGIKFALEKEKEVHPEKNPALRLFKKLMPVTSTYEGDRFVVKRDGKWWATPLLVVLVVIETTDVIFAIDSVPAVLAISLDPFIVYSSNAFAILGLRALYFALAGMMQAFHHLHYGLSAILIFIGIKMMIAKFFHIPIWAALGFISVTLTLSIIASLIWPQPAEAVIPVTAEPPALPEK
jgi:tellurite resistance protein TerC